MNQKKNQDLIDQIATNYTNEIEVIFKSKEEDLKKI